MNWVRFTLTVLGMSVLCVCLTDVQAESGSLLNEIEQEIASILESNRPGVVRIHTLYSGSDDDSGLQFGKTFTHGTGFVFDSRGYVVTIEGAVRGADQILVATDGGRQIRATYVASDPISEVAVIRLDSPAGTVPVNLPVLPLGNSDKVRVGHYSFILGNTFGTLSPSFGSVHEIHRDPDLIQIRASVHPGYGGAPVFGSTGEVIGMVWAEPDPGDLPESEAGFTPWRESSSTVLLIPINRVMRIAKRLVESGEMAYGGLGVEIEERERGVLVTWVQPDGPAFNAGWKKGDLILSYDGRPVAGAYHLRRMVNETTPGTSVMLEVERDNAPVIASVTVGEMMKGTSVGQTVSQAGGSEVVVRRIASLEQKLGGLRSYLEDGTSSSLSMQMFGNPGDRRSGNDGGFLRPQKTIVSQQIDELEREIGRLRRILRGQ